MVENLLARVEGLLLENHPRTRFALSVVEERSSALGGTQYPEVGSIEVSWEDGASLAAVEATLSVLEGAREEVDVPHGIPQVGEWGMRWPTGLRRVVSSEASLALLVEAARRERHMKRELDELLSATPRVSAERTVTGLMREALLVHARAQNGAGFELGEAQGPWEVEEHVSCEGIEPRLMTQTRLAFALVEDAAYPFDAALRLMWDPTSAVHAALVERVEA